MPITALPTPPSRSDPTNFATRADAFLGALPTFTTQANALEAENAAAATAAAGAVLSAKLNTNNPAFTGTLTGPGATFSGSFGYGSGAGGTVTQVTNKLTGVTLNKPSGTVTMHNAALAAGASVTFLISNTFFGANDSVVLTGTSWSLFYRIETANSSAGSIGVRVTNTDASSRSDALVFNFSVIKGSTT